ncbi:MAG: N-methyl-L-tryptophan oxidase [Planctomycetaceae bacterium]|nr:N-methyl-L-tryptophan oxidase [Planctomycetaceae bacterium]
MTKTYDAIVLGVGGFGSAALFHLARRGVNVLGIERFGIAHDRGSSHGETRIIRKAYFEHPDYVPLLHRAYELWRELEALSGKQLYWETGLVLSGPPRGETIIGALEAAGRHGVRVDAMTLADARERFPLFAFAEDDAVVLEPEAGYLKVEDCVATHIEQAQRQGASLLTNQTVRSWSVAGSRVRVVTDKGTIEAPHLVIAAGAWSGAMLGRIGVSLSVLRKPLFWHDVSTPDWRETSAFYFERPHGAFYGFPSVDGQTIKLAEHSGGVPVDDPLTVDRGRHDVDLAPVHRFITESLRHVSPQPRRHAVCMYTMSPDAHFLIDRHPEYPQVVFGAGFSGHGFKFTSVVGEVLADLTIEGQTSRPVGFLGLERFGTRNAGSN